MNIYINNAQKQIHEAATLTDMLSSMNLVAPKGIAIAINNNVIPKTEWDNYALNEADKITIIKATQGG